MNSDSVASGATAAQPSAPSGVPAVVAGIDVGKSWLDAHLEPGGLGRRALCKWLRKHGASRAVFEPTGRYHRRLHQCLAAAGVETVAVRPARRRQGPRSLRALGGLGGDRAAGSGLGRVAGSGARAAALRRRVRRPRPLGAGTRVQVHRASCALGAPGPRAPLDKDLLEAIEADDGLRRRAEVLGSVPGIGALTAATLLADMPELGTLGRRAAGALLGVAPRDRDSGSTEGRRHVRGGRAEPRSALYMAALTATRYNPPLAAFYKRLRDRGKQPKLALVAVMRKLVALLRADRLWPPSAPSAQVPA